MFMCKWGSGAAGNGWPTAAARPRFAGMAPLAPLDYLAHLQRESTRFREVLATTPADARVPGCPDWSAADLLWHLAEVQWFWAEVVRTRPSAPAEDAPGPERPASYDALLAAFDQHSAALLAQLRSADPADPAWTWSSEQTVGFTYRRQALEALVHRVDAEQTAGRASLIDPALAADGVLEALDVMFGGTPPWGRFDGSGQHVRVDCTDTGDRVWVELGRFTGTDPRTATSYDETDIGVVADPGGAPDAVVAGPAALLLTWLWRRTDRDDPAAGPRVSGDPDVHARFAAVVDQPLT